MLNFKKEQLQVTICNQLQAEKIYEPSTNLLKSLCFSFDQSFEVVKSVFSAFNLYDRVFKMINTTTDFQIATMTEDDFKNSNFGMVCESVIQRLVFNMLIFSHIYGLLIFM